MRVNLSFHESRLRALFGKRMCMQPRRADEVEAALRSLYQVDSEIEPNENRVMASLSKSICVWCLL